jgi:hypothetical protein
MLFVLTSAAQEGPGAQFWMSENRIGMIRSMPAVMYVCSAVSTSIWPVVSSVVGPHAGASNNSATIATLNLVGNFIPPHFRRQEVLRAGRHAGTQQSIGCAASVGGRRVCGDGARLAMTGKLGTR